MTRVLRLAALAHAVALVAAFVSSLAAAQAPSPMPQSAAQAQAQAQAQTQTQTQTQTQAQTQVPPPTRTAMQPAQRITAAGVAVSFDYVPAANEGDSAGAGITRIAFEDATSARALSGVRPVAWWVARRSPAQLETACADRAKSLASGSLGSRADVDLNAYRLVTLNQDRTVAFLDPFVRLHTSRLQGLVELPAIGHDAVWLRESRLLVVSAPDADAVAVIDTSTRRLKGLVRFEAGSRPTRLVRDGGTRDGARLWVGLDGRGEVAAIDAVALVTGERVAIGKPGALLLAHAPDSSRLAVASAGDDDIAVIDRRAARVVGRARVDAHPAALAWSAAARGFVVADDGGGLSVFDDQGTRRARIDGDPGVPTLALADGGRIALVANARTSTVALVDLATSQRLDTTPVAAKPDQIVLTSDYAYVRGAGAAEVTMLPLARARAGRLEPVRLPMGSTAPSAMPRAINTALPMIVPAPEGRGAWIAHASDRALYRYTEGLMASSGSLGNDKRQPRGMLVLDDNLQEREPGRFEAFTRPPHGGTFDVIVALGQPAVAACFSVRVDGASAEQVAQAAKRLLASVESIGRDKHGATRIDLELRGPDGAALATIDDAELLVFDARTQWQHRGWLRESAPGRYGATLHLPAGREPQDLVWLVGSRSLDAPLAAHRLAFDATARGRP